MIRFLVIFVVLLIPVFILYFSIMELLNYKTQLELKALLKKQPDDVEAQRKLAKVKSQDRELMLYELAIGAMMIVMIMVFTGKW